jgi:hypothetical protein
MNNTAPLAAVWTVEQKVDFFCYMVRRFPRPNEWCQLASVEWNDGDQYPTWATYRYTVTPQEFKDLRHDIVTPDTFKAHRHE